MRRCAKDLRVHRRARRGRECDNVGQPRISQPARACPAETSGGFPHSTGHAAPREVACSSGFPAPFLRHREISRPIGVRPEGIYGIFPGKVSDGPRNIVTAILCKGIKQLMYLSRLKACFIRLLATMQYFLRRRASEDVHGRVMTWC